MRNGMAAALLMFCLALSACGTTTKRSVEALRPDRTNPERMVCEPAGTRPKAPPEYVIDWKRIETSPSVAVAVARMREEHAHFVATLRTREGIVAGYIVQLEGKHFLCFSNMAWQRDYYSRLPEPSQ